MKKEMMRKNGLATLKVYLTAETGSYKITVFEDTMILFPSFLYREIKHADKNMEKGFYSDTDVFALRPIILYPKRKFMYGDMETYLNTNLKPFESFVKKDYKIVDPESKLSIYPILKPRNKSNLPIGNTYDIEQINAAKSSIKLEPYNCCIFIRELNGITMITIYDTLSYLAQFGRTITDMEVFG